MLPRETTGNPFTPFDECDSFRFKQFRASHLLEFFGPAQSIGIDVNQRQITLVVLQESESRT